MGMPPRRTRLPRLTHEEETRAAIERHTQLVGEIAWAWNDLHQAFAYIFGAVVRPDHNLMTQALWNALTSDSAQRDALKAVVEWDGLGRSNRERILWALKETGELRVYRNDVIHGPVGFRGTDKGVTTRFAPSNPFGRWLRHLQNDTELVPVMIMLRDDLRRLEAYATGVWRSLDPSLQRPSPRRPRLKLRRTLAGRYIRIATGKQTRKRKRQRPPSRQKPRA